MENIPNMKINVKKYFFIEDYFVFDQNDIDLYKMKKCFDNNQNLFKMSEKDIKCIRDNMEDLIIYFQKNEFTNFSFPLLKNCVISYIDAISKKFKNIYLNYYFFMIILSNRKKFSSALKNYYFHIIQMNYFGILPKYSNVLTKEVMSSQEYNSFTSHLAEWYTHTEMIIFYITIINSNFNNSLNFDEKKYSLETNFDFSIKSFAKKNFFKLASYACRHLSIDVKLGQINYQKLLFTIATSYTCGLSVNQFFTNDLKQFAFVGGFVINYLIGKLADKMENYSNFVEFSRLEDVIKKLNKKLNEINKKVYELLKLLILIKLDLNQNKSNCIVINCGEHQDQSDLIYNQSSKIEEDCADSVITYEIYPQISKKIDELMHDIKKYFEEVEPMNEEIEDRLNNSAQDFEEEIILSSIANDWIYLKPGKNK